ncbi:MAG TPA: group II truncated hemoglobin [Pelomicrobium sp.]|nr:group II truncated hemoglobin [Pelomicrobium sp.]
MQQTQTPYELLGGEAGVRRLVQRFYALMDELPEAYGIRRLHPADLSGSEQKLYEFLTGWLGGPPLYVGKHGHPRLRARHLPFPIASAERDEWLLCMRRALDETVDDEALRERLFAALADLADHMVNRAGPRRPAGS